MPNRAAASRAGEHPLGSFSRGWSAGTGTFERWEADPAPCGAEALAISTSRDAQSTPYTKVRCRQWQCASASDDAIWRPPRALIGPRCACLQPARASLSLGKLPPYHTMRGCSLDPRAEPMSRHHDRCAQHECHVRPVSGVPRWSAHGAMSAAFSGNSSVERGLSGQRPRAFGTITV